MGFGKERSLCSDSSSKESFLNSVHGEHILQEMNIFRKSGTFTDVVLLVEDQEFPCHRAMLCAISCYFRSMFMGKLRESCQSVVQLQEVSAIALEYLLNFIYEGQVELQEETVETVFQAAHLLDVPLLTQACVEFLESRVCPFNCLGLIAFAQRYSLESLLQKCQNVLYQEFSAVAKQEEFLELPLDRVLDLLNSDKLQYQEEVLVEAALLWVHYQSDQRRALLVKLLERMRLPLLDPIFFTNVLEADELVQESHGCRKLLQEARLYRLCGREISSERTKPRRHSGWDEVIVVIGGCSGIPRISIAEKMSPATGNWLPLAIMPGYAKHEFAACELQNDIYLSGGQLNSSDMWRYMSQLNQWVRVGSLITGRWRHRMTSFCGKLYAVGGCNGHQLLNSVECYNVFQNTWKTVAPLLLPVSSAAVACCSGKLYVISGAASDQCNTNRVQCYDPAKNQWTYKSPCPFSQRNINAVSLNGFIYVAGGLLDIVYCYNVQDDSWTKAAKLPMKLESCGLTVNDGKVFIIGGQDEFAIVTNRIWVFDPLCSQMIESTPLTHKLSNHACITITQQLKQK